VAAPSTSSSRGRGCDFAAPTARASSCPRSEATRASFPAEISLAHFDGPGGTLTVAAIRDGSERAGREAELREARERFRRVFEDSPVAMALVGDDFRLSEVNDAFCRLTGYSAHELAELTFADITHPGDVDTDLRLAGTRAA
jgi:PAS domain-containing protein